ncbi:TetR/AcrR family transcriptional regulator [Microbacterium sp. NPDC089318]
MGSGDGQSSRTIGTTSGVGRSRDVHAVEANPAPRLTKRGAATRARIVHAAADLIRTQGVGRTTLDEVIALSEVSKSQFYRHFEDRSALVLGVIDHVGRETLKVEREQLSRVHTISGLRQWRDSIVASTSAGPGRHACALGTLVADISPEDVVACRKLDEVFAMWRALFETLLTRLRDQGAISTEANVTQIAGGFIVAVQGGCLLARAAGNIEPMASAIDLSIDHLQLLAHTDGVKGPA